jgi:NAD+ kinase
MIRSVGIVCKPNRELVASVAPSLLDWLRQRKIDAFVDEETRACVDLPTPVLPRTGLSEKIELVIVLGGDGTVLSAARALGSHRIPILAVNLGGLGFLTSVTLDELYPVLEQVFAGKHTTSERMMLDAEIIRKGHVSERQHALNDAVATKAALARMLEFDVYVDRNRVGRYRADGIIVATPTGSTAYSLAAGGPIIDPQLDAFVITPICPHMLTNRPLVIPHTAIIDLDFAPATEPVYITLDGQIGFQLEPKDRVIVTKSASRVTLVRPPHKTYFEVLRNKLRWSER